VVDAPSADSNNIMAPGISLSNNYRESYNGKIIGFSAQKILDGLHYISAGAVGFARGMNDAPKIAGLLLLVNFLSVPWMLIMIAVIMAVGGLLNSKKLHKP
jgi:PiT family inorganic phosphate transporter